MNALCRRFYTNEVSSEFLQSLDQAPFTEQQLEGFSEQALACHRQNLIFCENHPPIAIRRMATEGSQTRYGGVIVQASGVVQITLEDDQEVRVARVGDYALYANGQTARIVTGAGQSNSHVALVGSQLDNGDTIINTPQNVSLFVIRDGSPMPEDFLPCVGNE